MFNPSLIHADPGQITSEGWTTGDKCQKSIVPLPRNRFLRTSWGHKGQDIVRGKICQKFPWPDEWEDGSLITLVASWSDPGLSPPRQEFLLKLEGNKKCLKGRCGLYRPGGWAS